VSGPGARLLGADGPVRLGARIGRGGEGEVYAVEGAPDRCAKLYRQEIAAERAPKIAAMVAAGLGDAMRLVSFPGAELRRHDGAFAGFLMPKVEDAEPIHELYAPGARKRVFPEADYRFLVRAALNAARAVAAAHRAGCVIGDVNHSGFLIGRDALVSLIDADSFQFHDGKTLHLCRVGVPEYTPPELQGRPLAGLERAADHDAFGLAVLLFQLLFLGRHPFAGVAREKDADIPVEDAIAAHDFAYDRRRRTRLKPPPSAPRLDEIHPESAALFERAFAPDAAGARPTAEDWAAALDRFEAALTQCTASPRHHHAAGGAGCPWCRLERKRKTKLFPAPGEPGAAPVVPETAQLAARLEAIALPEIFEYAPPPPHPGSEPPPTTARQALAGKAEALVFGTMMAFGVALVWVAPQSFWMCIPVWWYGLGPVGDALSPSRAARRALAKLDRRIEIEMGLHQDRADLDAAWLLRADIAGRLARGGRATLARAAEDLPRLEAMATALADARTQRNPAVEALLARRAQLVRQIEQAGETPAPPPGVAPRRLRPSTRERLARAKRIAAQ
jgi:DNA-binding helix-hairpin-helix protein with protein kinase domain